MNLYQIVIRKVSVFVKKPSVLLIKVLYRFSFLLSDDVYLKMLFPLKVGYKLNLQNPVTYNEKLQWLKLNYRKEYLINLVDKFEFKNFARNCVGNEYIIQTYGVWDSFDEIDFSSLPEKFVLKTTHDQGGVVVCRDKNTLDLAKVEQKINKHLYRKNLYFLMREWPYKFVKPRIIAEELLIEDDDLGLKDYKIYCFHGEPKLLYVSYGRQGDKTYLDFYDIHFNRVNIRRPKYPQPEVIIDMPDNYDVMLDLARKLSKNHPHVRIDFYNINGQIKVGEFTLYQGGGMMPFIPVEWDYELGTYLNLDKIN